MKKMLMGIFLLLLSIWCFIFAELMDASIMLLPAISLPIPALICFLLGFAEKK